MVDHGSGAGREMGSLPSGTLTFLFTDIEGSTKLWEQHPQAMRAALAQHDALLRETFAAHGGHVFKTVGDAFCVVFPTARASVAAAVEAQNGLQAASWDDTPPLQVRIALHSGAADERDGDYFGPSLNRVARLMAAGHGGQTLLSTTTHELVRDDLPGGISLRDLGEQRLRDLARPEHVYQLVDPGLPGEFPPLRTLDRFPTNLPTQLTSFIGREHQVDEVKHLIATARLVTLTGVGGVGKTRLSLQVGADLLEEFPDGVWFVELAPITDSELVARQVAAAVGLQEAPGRPLIATLQDYLQAKEMLLILDNCEHVIGACAVLAETFVRACPKLRVLAASREALGVAGEFAWPVPSLSVPDDGQAMSLNGLMACEAARLLVDRAQAVSPRFSITESALPAVSQICKRLDGIPLALELAAARLKVLSAEQIASRLDDRFRLLTGGSRTALPRQQTLQALVDWSYELLSESERTLFVRLSVFSGGFGLEAAESVGAGDEVAEYQVLDLLSQLVDKSLVQVEERDGDSRYRLLETLRQYGVQKLIERGEVEPARARHADYYAAFAEGAEPHLWGPGARLWMNRLEVDHDNLRAALGWLVEAGAAERALVMAGALRRFWWVRGYHREGHEWLTTLLDQTGPGEVSMSRARALSGVGLLAFFRGRPDLALAPLDEAVAMARALGNEQFLAQTLAQNAMLLSIRADTAAARPLVEEALTLARRLGDRWCLAIAMGQLGMTAFMAGDHENAQHHLEESAALFEAVDDGQASWAQNFLGRLFLTRGEFARARPVLERALTVAQTGRYSFGIGMATSSLAVVAVAEHDHAAALSCCREAFEVARVTGNGLMLPVALEARAILAGALGYPDAAVRLAAAAGALKEVMRFGLPPAHGFDSIVASAREALGEESAAAAWAAGHAMTADAALAYALQITEK